MTSIASLIEERQPLSVKVGKGRLNIVYNPNTITMAESALAKRMAEAGDALATAKSFCRQVVEWDATGELRATVVIEPEPNDDSDEDEDDEDEDFVLEERVIVAQGDPIPLDPEIVQYIGIPVLYPLMQAIQKDAVPDPTAAMNRRGRRATAATNGRRRP